VYYCILLNITGIPSGYEANATNNLALSNPIFYTEQIIHVPSITSFAAGYDRKGTLVQPVIEGEETTIRVKVKNNGNEKAIYNVTVYANDTIVISDETSELLPGAVEDMEWEHSFVAGYYNITVVAQIDDIMDIRIKWLRVIKTPNLTITYAPQTPLVNQIVILNASSSTHQDPKGNIATWTWYIYEPGVDPWVELPVAIKHGSIITFNFTKAGNWTVVLRVEDNYNMTYDVWRPLTANYTIQLTVNVMSIVGDVNGDSKVTIEDVILAASQFMLTPEDPTYDPTIVKTADVAPPYNGIINICDLVTIAAHYGETYP